MINVITTFSGCGGSSLGYRKAGFNIKLATDWETNAVKTYQMNFPDTPILHAISVTKRSAIQTGNNFSCH